MKIPALISFGGEMDEPVLNRDNRSFKKYLTQRQYVDRKISFKLKRRPACRTRSNAWQTFRMEPIQYTPNLSVYVLGEDWSVVFWKNNFFSSKFVLQTTTTIIQKKKVSGIICSLGIVKNYIYYLVKFHAEWPFM